MSEKKYVSVQPKASAAILETECWVNYLIIGSFLFPLGHALAIIPNPTHYPSSRFLHQQFRYMFDVTDETSLSTWATISVMLMVGIVCLVLFRAQKRWGWLLPGMLFVFLSADDGAMIHERVGKLLHESVGAIIFPVFGETFVYIWVLTVGPLLVLLGFGTLLFLFRAFRHRPRALRDVILGFGFMAVALAIEAVEGPVGSEGYMLFGKISLALLNQMVEEWLELVGPLLVLRAVAGELELDLRNRLKSQPTG